MMEVKTSEKKKKMMQVTKTGFEPTTTQLVMQ